MQTATMDAASWWARSRGATADHWIGNYQRSLENRHRVVISDLVGRLGAQSVLEVGCHCGPNLVRLAQDHAGLTQITGLDVSAEAIQAGQRWIETLGIADRVQLVVGRVPGATGALADGCADVVLSSYALAYVAPGDLDAVLWELGRLARRAVVLAEPMTETGPGAVARMTVDGYHEWAHNYREAARWMGSWAGMTLQTVAIDPPVDRLERVLVADRGAPSESPMWSSPSGRPQRWQRH